MLSVHVRMPASRKRCGKNGTGTGRGGQAEEIIKQKTCLKAIKLKSRFHAAKQALLEGNRYDQCPGEKGALLYFSFFKTAFRRINVLLSTRMAVSSYRTHGLQSALQSRKRCPGAGLV